MTIENKELERWLTQMEHTSTSVGIAGKSYTAQIREIIADENLVLPEGCPSKASLMELTPLHRIEKNLDDANHTFKELRDYIWKHYGNS